MRILGEMNNFDDKTIENSVKFILTKKTDFTAMATDSAPLEGKPTSTKKITEKCNCNSRMLFQQFARK